MLLCLPIDRNIRSNCVGEYKAPTERRGRFTKSLCRSLCGPSGPPKKAKESLKESLSGPSSPKVRKWKVVQHSLKTVDCFSRLFRTLLGLSGQKAPKNSSGNSLGSRARRAQETLLVLGGAGGFAEGDPHWLPFL